MLEIFQGRERELTELTPLSAKCLATVISAMAWTKSDHQRLCLSSTIVHWTSQHNNKDTAAQELEESQICKC